MNRELLQFALLEGEELMLIHQQLAHAAGRRRRPRTMWVRPWLAADRRLQFGQYDQLMEELRLEDEQSFRNYLRMEPALFDEILQRVGPAITKQDTRMRPALEPGLKLAVTLRFLATGDKYPTLQYDYRVARNTISLFVPEVCRAIREVLKREVIKCPTTPEEWRPISEDFERRANVSHAVAALDGKHVAVRCPPNTGTLYHNYKGFFSVVLLALVDANYKFLWIDTGGLGSQSDCQIFNASELKEALESGDIGFPDPDPLPNDDRDLPYFILGDDAFGLRKYLMKPYSQRGLTRDQRIYNYRISRGRRVVENAFGILAQRFQVLLSTMQLAPESVRDVIEACVCLHNLMRERYGAQNLGPDVDHEDDQHNLIPGEWRQHANMHEVDQVVGPNRDAVDGKRQRELLRLYYNSPAGAVPWQDRMIGDAGLGV
jgi:hypothetical protein